MTNPTINDKIILEVEQAYPEHLSDEFILTVVLAIEDGVYITKKQGREVRLTESQAREAKARAQIYRLMMNAITI